LNSVRLATVPVENLGTIVSSEAKRYSTGAYLATKKKLPREKLSVTRPWFSLGYENILCLAHRFSYDAARRDGIVRLGLQFHMLHRKTPQGESFDPRPTSVPVPYARTYK
jgi:hypothetical protein